MLRLPAMMAVLVCVSQPLLCEDVRTIQVTGTSMQSAPADKATLNIGVISQDSNADKALSLNQTQMNQVLNALQKLGLGKGEVKTLGFDLSPQYAPRPKNPPEDWKPNIVGYEVRNRLQVDTEKLELLGKIISTASAAGANQIDSISFGLKNAVQVQQDAIQKAIGEARAFADAAAKQTGVKIKRVYRMSVNPSSISPRFMKSERFALASAPATPVLPGDVEVNASVNIDYEID